MVIYKNLAESGHLFNHSGGVIPRTLNVLSRILPSDLNFKTILFYVFSPIHAYCILKFYHIISFFGMYLLARFLLRDNEKENKNLISTIIALMFSLIPFWPTGELTVAGQPLLCFHSLT